MSLDFAELVYAYQVFIHGMGGILFVVNWIRVRKVSAVYKYITFILWAATYHYSLSVYVRHIKHTTEDYLAFLDSWIWHTRSIPLALGLTIFIGHMAYRFFVQRKSIEETK